MLKKIVAIVTLAIGVVTSAFIGTAPASAAEVPEAVAAIESDDSCSNPFAIHNWKRCGPPQTNQEVVVVVNMMR